MASWTVHYTLLLVSLWESFGFEISVSFIVPFEVAILSAADMLVYGLLSWCMVELAMLAATRLCAAFFSSAW